MAETTSTDSGDESPDIQDRSAVERKTDATGEETATESSESVTGDAIEVGSALRVGGGAALLGLYASWAAADVATRWLTFVVVTLVVGYRLAEQSTVRKQSVTAGYVLAALLAITPVLVVLPDVLSAGQYGVSGLDMVALRWNLYLFVLFAIPASVVAYLAYRLDGNPGIVSRIRR